MTDLAIGILAITNMLTLVLLYSEKRQILTIVSDEIESIRNKSQQQYSQPVKDRSRI